MLSAIGGTPPQPDTTFYKRCPVRYEALVAHLQYMYRYNIIFDSLSYSWWPMLTWSIEIGKKYLDLELATRNPHTSSDRQSFKEYSSLVKKLRELREKRMDLDQLVSSLNNVATRRPGYQLWWFQSPRTYTHP